MKSWRWIEVDLSALRHNARTVRQRLGPRVPFAAVVKADGYGHGAVAAAREFLSGGAGELAVTYLEEALPLRRAGLRAPILLMGPLDPGDAALAVKNNLTVMVDNLPLARALGRRAGRRPVAVHIKVDSGLRRWGIPLGDFVPFFGKVRKVPGVRVAGVFAHPGYMPGKNEGEVRRLLADFDAVVRPATAAFPGVRRHVADSAVLLDFLRWRDGGARIGNLLYGINPTNKVLGLKNPWRAMARVVRVTDVRRGESIGYGGEFRAPRALRLATLPVGYSHGFALRFGNAPGPSWVPVPGGRAALIGRVGMSHTLIDVTSLQDVRPGQSVEIPLRRTLSAGWPRLYL